jgi:predicted RNA-binding protein YlqC (UPF0109 family)
MAERGVELISGDDEMLNQMDLPIIDLRTNQLTDIFTAPGGHGQWGVRLLYDVLGFTQPEDGKTHIRAFYNGDGVANLPDASIVGWMARNKVALVMISTTKAGLDKKGGQIGVQILDKGLRRVQMLELAQAKKPGKDHEQLFYAIGLPGKEKVSGTNFNGDLCEYSNEAGRQYFNSLPVELLQISKSELQLKTMQENDTKFLDLVVKALVDAPDKVKITRTVDEMGVLLTLVVDNADMGKVIGRSGNTAKAIRTLLRVVGMKNNSRVNLKINEPEGAEPRMATL